MPVWSCGCSAAACMVPWTARGCPACSAHTHPHTQPAWPGTHTPLSSCSSRSGSCGRTWRSRVWTWRRSGRLRCSPHRCSACHAAATTCGRTERPRVSCRGCSRWQVSRRGTLASPTAASAPSFPELEFVPLQDGAPLWPKVWGDVDQGYLSEPRKKQLARLS